MNRRNNQRKDDLKANVIDEKGRLKDKQKENKMNLKIK